MHSKILFTRDYIYYSLIKGIFQEDMAASRIPATNNSNNDKILELRFLGITEKDQAPRVALFAVEKGVIRKVGPIQGNKVQLSELARNIKEGSGYGFGPDIDEKEVTREMLVTFRPREKVAEWSRTGVISITPKWRDWILPIVCVHGDVHRCRPRPWLLGDIAVAKTATKILAKSTTFTDTLTLRPEISKAIAPSLTLPTICAPICNAVVEVYEKTCCCRLRPPFDIDDILDRLKDLIKRVPPIPDPDPGPIGPWPGPGPDPVPIRQVEKAASLLRATGAKVPLGNPPEKLAEDYHMLMSLPQQDRLAYIDAHYYLYPIFCTCSTRKVGETPVNEDGEFSFCYWRPFVRAGCRVTYYYKVRQWQDNQWVYIYDGSTTNDYFTASDDAHLRTWKGRACNPGSDVPDPGTNFVMLENIGYIPSWKLVSPVQDSELGVLTANPGDGLVNNNYTGQPWGQTLSFRLKFHEGMKGTGAKYYRVSVVKANSSGDPDGVPQVLTDPVAWSRWKWVGTQLQTEAVALGPNAVGSNSGLYLIPYESDAPDGGWLWFQFHQSWNTTLHDNGKHLVIVEVFDAAGNRIKPAGAMGAGIDKPFTFRRWSTETATDAVNYAALVHIFHADNVACYGDIVALRKNDAPVEGSCLFLTGCSGDKFTVRFYAFHVNKFMHSYNLWFVRGLNDTSGTIETGTTNAPSTVPPIPSPLNAANAKAAEKTFGEMLGAHQKCSFAIELRVYPKHTNGFGIITGYGASDTAAVALEQVPCVDLGSIPRIAATAEKIELPK